LLDLENDHWYKSKLPDDWYVNKILITEGLKILKSEGIEKFNKWFERDWLPIMEKDEQNILKYGTVHMAELARKEGWTVNDFLHEHLLARAQGEAVQKEIEKEKQIS